MTWRCATADELTTQALALLPRGRAWRSRDGGPRAGDVLYDFWRSVSENFAYLRARLCALRLEFWCATQSETNDLWMAEYGLPDNCDPFPDLCTKVAALGGITCDYYALTCFRFGWYISCGEPCGAQTGDYLRTGDSCAMTGDHLTGGESCGMMGNRPGPCVIIFYVRVSSPSYAADTGLVGLNCLLRRIVHAENDIQYVLVD